EPGPAGVGEHIQDVKLRAARVEVDGAEDLGPVPFGLPLRLDALGMIGWHVSTLRPRPSIARGVGRSRRLVVLPSKKARREFGGRLPLNVPPSITSRYRSCQTPTRDTRTRDRLGGTSWGHRVPPTSPQISECGLTERSVLSSEGRRELVV